MSGVDVVLIGRNEGDRLKAALAAARPQARQLVYVDSGSTDDSVAAAQAAGATVVALDMSVPFTAARARNAGFDALDAPDIVQFIDGDCALTDGWLATGAARLHADDGLGLVTGWRVEKFPETSIYNRLMDWEWRRPAGPITVCSGDMMVRATIWRDLGGMAPDMIAGEDEDFCLRMAQAGWSLERLPHEMTRHDAAMTRFAQWWTRSVRGGHAYAELQARHPGHAAREQQRAVVYGAVLPVVGSLGSLVSPWIGAAVLAVFGASYLRSTRALIRDGLPMAKAWRLGALLVLSKLPNLIGMLRYRLRRHRKAKAELIEYK